MDKSAVKSTTSEGSAKNAKRLFFIGLADISWRLAAAIMVPVLSGAWLDDRQNTGDLFTLIGLIVGIILAGYVIYRVSKKLNKDVENV